MAATKRKSDGGDRAISPNTKRKRSSEAASVTKTAAATRPRRSTTAMQAEVKVSMKQDSAMKKAKSSGSTKAQPKSKSMPPKVEPAKSHQATPSEPVTAKEPPAKTQAKVKAKETPKKSVTKQDDEEEPAEKTKAKPSKASATLTGHERGPNEVCYWLMKAEPESRIENGVDVKFSIEDLRDRTDPEPWDGVRNPMAQKNMRTMRQGDLGFFYHSNCKVPGIAGVLRIVQEHSVDESAFDPKHPYYDPKSSREKPRWCVVHVEHVCTFDTYVPLKELQKHSSPGEPLADMQVLRMSRLSVSRVTAEQWEYILHKLAGTTEEEMVRK